MSQKSIELDNICDIVGSDIPADMRHGGMEHEQTACGLLLINTGFMNDKFTLIIQCIG